MSHQYEPICKFFEFTKFKHFLYSNSIFIEKIFRKKVYKSYSEYLVGFYFVNEIFKFFDSKSNRNFTSIERISYCYKLIHFIVELDYFKSNDIDLFNCYREILNFSLELYTGKFNENKYTYIKNFVNTRKYGNIQNEFNIDEYTFFCSDSHHTWHSFFNLDNYFKEHPPKSTIKFYILFLGKGSIISGLDLINIMKPIFKDNLDFDIINLSLYKKKEKKVSISNIMENKILEKRKKGYDILIFQEDIHSGKTLDIFIKNLSELLINDVKYLPLVLSNLITLKFQKNSMNNDKFRWCGILPK